MGTHRLELDVNAPRDVVYGLWTDLDRMAEWIEGITRVDAPARKASAGMTYKILWFERMPSTVEVLAADPPRSFQSRSTSRILSVTNGVEFEALPGGGTRLIQTFRTHGLLSGFFARIFSLGSFKGSFRGELLSFKRLCEAQAGTSGDPA